MCTFDTHAQLTHHTTHPSTIHTPHCSEYCTSHHLLSHDLQLLSIARSAVQVASGNEGASTILDKDYTLFDTQTSLKQTSYNYLDPNFYPAS